MFTIDENRVSDDCGDGDSNGSSSGDGDSNDIDNGSNNDGGGRDEDSSGDRDGRGHRQQLTKRGMEEMTATAMVGGGQRRHARSGGGLQWGRDDGGESDAGDS